MLISDLSSEQLLMLIGPALPNMWALKHAMYHDFPTPKEKYRWMLACVFLPCVAGVAYYFIGRKHASKEKIDIRARMEAERKDFGAENAVIEQSREHSLTGGQSSAVEEVSQPQSENLSCLEDARKISSTAGDAWSFGCPDSRNSPKK
ncbi:MAG: hypothetical protein ACI4P0_06255 [Mailhella sp.]